MIFTSKQRRNGKVSKYATEHIIEGINSVKQKLRTNYPPADAQRIRDIAIDASNGSIPPNEHLRTMRVVLAVYEYMEAVNNRMENEIQNVKTEFSNKNIQSIVRDEKGMPQDEHGKVVDLGALWQEHMQKLLARFERKGVDCLNNRIKNALPLYKNELQRLQKYVARFKTEGVETNLARKSELQDARSKKGNEYNKRLGHLLRDLRMAKKDHKEKNDKLDSLLRQVVVLHKGDKQKMKDKRKSWSTSKRRMQARLLTVIYIR
ncbi:hypothetical protein BU23DRAFT_563834 [Bimuria novae-zelandiae CBS 107.79]|uniref:Uncharacterized protein n=1 Tax=Bimuria novae-zelandiae CBS 107.79 TaxID=1447943 RepID=A0A6A5VQB2_9PLEO|nr:hypothetical protein BU23DRAFT_563834 [Bimuria novae-zelandiae CBS 107.79]